MQAPPKKKGEIGELQDNLASTKLDQKKAAVRKIIEAMTRGKDVSMLFTDVVKNMATTDLELKKLIYLYIINYAKSHPDLAILAINTFRKDARDKANPFLRALAVRTMGCIRVKQITEYLCDPLKDAIKDEDPYVRKTAAICVAKLYDVAPELLEEQGFIKMLENLMNDGNGMVVSNTIAALSQISETKGFNMISLTPYTVQKLLTALQECTEWGQIYILDALTGYTPSSDGKEVENILERVSPRLSHSNSGVVLSAVKLIMKYLDFISNPESIRNYCRKLNSPLISLIGTEPEIQFVALKNINLIIQKRQLVFDKELKIFFCNFNDPIFIKLEKLEILIKLSSYDNIQQILHELKEYTSEVDVEFVKKAVRAIGRCAIKLEKAAEKCVHVLWECVKSKVGYVVQESIIVIRDIFRKYPKKYEALLKDICESIKSLDDPEAKASFIWIIGEYIDTIENSDMLLANFAEGFKDEPSVVQHQIMTSCLKLFLLRPSDGHELLEKLLKTATTECENPDLRDRAFIYWRLLAIDPELTKKIVFADRPTISDQSYTLDSVLLDILIENIGSLSSIYTKRPETFVKRLRESQNIRELEENDEDPEELMANAGQGYQSDMMMSTSSSLGVSQKPMMEQPIYETGMGENTNTPPVYNASPPVQQSNDLLDVDNLTINEKPAAVVINSNTNDLLMDETDLQKNSNVQPNANVQPNVGLSNFNNIKIPYCNVVNLDQPTTEKKITGIMIEGAFQRENDLMLLYLRITNKTPQLLNDFAVKFNANSFRLQPANIELNIATINPNQTNEGKVVVNCNGNNDNNPPAFPFRVQVALKFNLDIHVFFVPCSLTVIMTPSASLNPNQYIEETTKPNTAKKQDVLNITLTAEEIKDRFVKNNINFVGSRTNPNGQEMHSFSARLVNDIVITLDMLLVNNNMMMQYICPHPSLLPLFYQAVGFVLK